MACKRGYTRRMAVSWREFAVSSIFTYINTRRTMSRAIIHELETPRIVGHGGPWRWLSRSVLTAICTQPRWARVFVTSRIEMGPTRDRRESHGMHRLCKMINSAAGGLGTRRRRARTWRRQTKVTCGQTCGKTGRGKSSSWLAESRQEAESEASTVPGCDETPIAPIRTIYSASRSRSPFSKPTTVYYY